MSINYHNTEEAHYIAKTVFPSWLKALCSVGAALVVIVCSVIIFKSIKEGFTGPLFKALFFLVLIAACSFFAPVLFSSVEATESGIEVRSFGRIKKKLRWSEIVELKHPRFGIPYDAVYIVSSSGSKISIWYSMTGLKNFFDLLDSMARNLRPKPLPVSLRSPKLASAWAQSLVLLTFLIVYLLYRLLLG